MKSKLQIEVLDACHTFAKINADFAETRARAEITFAQKEMLAQYLPPMERIAELNRLRERREGGERTARLLEQMYEQLPAVVSSVDSYNEFVRHPSVDEYLKEMKRLGMPNADLAANASAIYMLQAWRSRARTSYVLTRDLALALQHTNVYNIPCDDIRLPYNPMYVELADHTPITTVGKGTKAEAMIIRIVPESCPHDWELWWEACQHANLLDQDIPYTRVLEVLLISRDHAYENDDPNHWDCSFMQIPLHGTIGATLRGAIQIYCDIKSHAKDLLEEMEDAGLSGPDTLKIFQKEPLCGWKSYGVEMKQVLNLVANLALYLESGAEQRRVMAPRKAAIKNVKGKERKAQRALQRAGKLSDVDRIILGEGVHYRPIIVNSGGGRSPIRQHIVRAHWKLQSYGPKGSLRKRIHVSDYDRGEADAWVRKIHMQGGKK